jgi:hypothetical protein
MKGRLLYKLDIKYIDTLEVCTVEEDAEFQQAIL